MRNESPEVAFPPGSNLWGCCWFLEIPRADIPAERQEQARVTPPIPHRQLREEAEADVGRGRGRGRAPIRLRRGPSGAPLCLHASAAVAAAAAVWVGPRAGLLGAQHVVLLGGSSSAALWLYLLGAARPGRGWTCASAGAVLLSWVVTAVALYTHVMTSPFEGLGQVSSRLLGE